MLTGINMNCFWFASPFKSVIKPRRAYQSVQVDKIMDGLRDHPSQIGHL